MKDVVIDLGYGDAGKGLVTDYLAGQHPSSSVVIRFSGGHQAGHTVENDKHRHVFSNFGAGTLRGVPTYWSSHCTVDPVGLVNELKILLELGYKPKLYINNKCPITTPYDKGQNQLLAQGDLFNSCGVGFGTTLQREEDHYKLNAFDLNYLEVFKQKVELIGTKYYKFRSNRLGEFYDAIDFMLHYSDIKIVDDIFAMDEAPSNEIYEGSQGLLLDKDVGFFPYVTRSNTGITNLLKMQTESTITNALLSNTEVVFWFVTRAYSTRHGSGPFKEGDITLNVDKETNVDNKYQGEFKVAPLDVDMLSYGLNKMIDNLYTYKKSTWRFNLVITCMDQMKSYELIKSNTKFVYSDKLEFINAVKASFDYKFVNVYTNDSPIGNLNLVM